MASNLERKEKKMTDITHEKSFPKQDAVFLAAKRTKMRKNKHGVPRYHRSVGLGFKTVFYFYWF